MVFYSPLLIAKNFRLPEEGNAQWAQDQRDQGRQTEEPAQVDTAAIYLKDSDSKANVINHGQCAIDQLSQ